MYQYQKEQNRAHLQKKRKMWLILACLVTAQMTSSKRFIFVLPNKGTLPVLRQLSGAFVKNCIGRCNSHRFLGQWMLLIHVQLFATPWMVACHASLSFEILQERIIEWVSIPSSRGSSKPRDRTHISSIARGFLTLWDTREAQWKTLGVNHWLNKKLGKNAREWDALGNTCF